MKTFFQKLDDLLASAGEAEYIGIDIPSEETEEYFFSLESGMTVPHTEPGAFQAIKSAIKGRGEQTVGPMTAGSAIMIYATWMPEARAGCIFQASVAWFSPKTESFFCADGK